MAKSKTPQKRKSSASLAPTTPVMATGSPTVDHKALGYLRNTPARQAHSAKSKVNRTVPRTPAMMKRGRKTSKIIKTSEELELQKIKDLRQANKNRKAATSRSFKKLAGASFSTLKSEKELTIPLDLNLATQRRARDRVTQSKR
eukprot:m.118200 g.118200  ORF g.118200 m.118200 type:complete len:144 (-) comp28641_c0_seq1:219-650(-)